MDIREAYRELGLNPNADDLQLKDAWRRLVSRWHPDRNRSPDAAVRIQRINKAYHHIRECRDDTDAPQEDVSRPNREAQPFAETQVIERLVKLSIEEAMLGCIRVVRGQLTHECRACSGKGQRIWRQPARDAGAVAQSSAPHCLVGCGPMKPVVPAGATVVNGNSARHAKVRGAVW